MIVVSSDQDTLTLRFNYARDYVSRVKKLGARGKKIKGQWLWHLPRSRLLQLEQVFKGELVYHTPRHLILGDPPPGLPDHVLAYPDDPLPGLLKLDLLPHQCRGVRFARDNLLKHGFALIQDTVGLGKTAEAIGTAEQLDDEGVLIGPVLVICLASLRAQWQDDGIHKFTDRRSVVIDQTPKKRRQIYDKWLDYDYVIINYELVNRDQDHLKKIPFSMVIMDEPHEKVLNIEGKMHNAVKSLNIPLSLLLTATPLNNSPLELFGLFDLCDPDILGSVSQFKKRYIRYSFKFGHPELVGYRHLDELRDLVQPHIIRRTRDDVNIRFPDIERMTRTLAPTSKQIKAYNHIQSHRQELQNELSFLDRIDNRSEKQEAEFERLRNTVRSLVIYELILSDYPSLLGEAKNTFIREEVSPPLLKEASPKFEMLKDMMRELKGEKIVIFTEFRKVALKLLRYINDNVGIAVPYVGGMSSKKQIRVRKAFNTRSDVVAMVATSAGYTGLNLPAGSVCIHYDLPWAPTRVNQREGRLTRLDSVHSKVVSYILLTKNLSDKRVYDAVIQKQAVFDFLVG